MRYQEYRRQGLPITSSYVESAVKQFNARVKGTEKFWTEQGAENNGSIWRDYFGSLVPILDFIHALSYVYAAAHAGRERAAGGRKILSQTVAAWINVS